MVLTKSKWNVSFNSKDNSSKNKIKEPIGWLKKSQNETISAKSNDSTQLKLKEAKAMEIAKSPLKNIPLSLFMSWMIGNQLNLFSMMYLSMMFYQPLTAISSVNTGMLVTVFLYILLVC